MDFLHVKHTYKRVRMSQKRAGQNKSVKKISVLAQIFTKLWQIYEFVSVAVSNHRIQIKNYEI